MGNGDFVRRGRKSQKCIMRLFWRKANLLGDAPVKKIMLSLYLSYAPGPILSKLGQNFDWLIHAYIFVLHRQLNLCVILLLYSSTAATELNTAAIRFFFSFTARLFILCLFIKSVRDSSMAAFLRTHSAKRKRCWPHLLAFRNCIASEYESLYFSLILLCLWSRA